MEDIQATFTRRILRRASQRRERDRKEAMNRSAHFSHRRSNILRAINDPSMSLVSYSTDINDREDLDRSYDSFCDTFNMTGYSHNDDNNNDEKSIDGNAIKSPASHREEEIPILVKVTERNIEVPVKMIAELKKIEVNETCNDTFDFTRTKRSSMSELEAMTKTSVRRSLNALSTEAVVEMCNRVSSMLTDIRHDPVDSKDLNNTDCFATADPEAINMRSSNLAENRPEEFTGGDDNSSRNKKTPVRRSVNTELTTVAVVKMCNRVSSVLTDIRCNSTDPKNFPDTDFPKIGEATNFRPRDFIQHQPKESSSPEADFSTKKSAESWDEDKFLEVALGEDRYENVTRENATRSDFSGFEPIADRSPLQKTVIEAPNLRSPKTPSNRTSTLDRSMRIYRTLSHRIKKKFRPIFRADRREETPEEPTTMSPSLDDSDRIRELLRELKIQQTIINQSTKALDLCTSLKQFTESTERVESERSLLLASLRGKSALEEIKSITSDERKEEIFSEKGEVTISELSLDLRSSLDSDRQEIEWFIVVVSHGLRVWATRAVNCRAEETRVNFPGSVSIANLTPGFKILVQVYSLKLGKDAYSDEDKYRTKRGSRKHFWPSTLSVFGKVDVSSPPIRNSVMRSANTSFVPAGFTELVLEDLSVSSPWPLMMVPADSRLKGSIDLNIACRLRFSISHEGFLNHGDEAGGLASWNRRWCVLRGHTLKFWNYPREVETKEPLKIIELVDCVSDEVATVDRRICAKPRTLLIETKRSRQPGDRNSIVIECKSACTIVRNLLSYDSARELEEWSRKINEVIVALEEWNVIGRRSQPSEI